MNAATTCRLKKEARALFPMWGVTAAWITLPFLLSAHDPLPFSLMGFLFGCCTFGPVVVGNEFTQGTISFLLAQPVPRRQLWREKLMVTGAALLGLSLMLVVLIQFKGHPDELFTSPIWNDPVDLILFVSLWVLVPIMAFCTGPVWTLIARNALGGGALTFLCPLMLLVLGVIIPYYLGISNQANEARLLMSYDLVVGSVYSAGMFWLGRRQFAGLEDVTPIRRDLALPDSWSRYCAGLAARLLPEKRGITTSLIGKELRLQQPAFWLAAAMVGFWLVAFAVSVFRPEIGGRLMVIPTLMLCLGIPIASGIVSTAEERSLGLHDWQLTLPASARHQWFVKVMLAAGLNCLLGLLLPWGMILGSTLLVAEPYVPGNQLGAAFIFVMINLPLFAAALYASTAAANPSRAIIGTILICIICAMISFHSDVLNNWLWRWSEQQKVQPPADLGLSFWSFQPYSFMASIVGLVGWLCIMAFPNFRYSLGSLRLPIQRLLVFFPVAWVVVNIVCADSHIRIALFHAFGW